MNRQLDGRIWERIRRRRGAADSHRDAGNENRAGTKEPSPGLRHLAGEKGGFARRQVARRIAPRARLCRKTTATTSSARLAVLQTTRTVPGCALLASLQIRVSWWVGGIRLKLAPRDRISFEQERGR